MNNKQLAFCQAYMTNGYNGLAAYQTAYPKASYKTAEANSSRLLSKANIKAFISEEQEKLRTTSTITKEELIRDLIYIKEISKDNQRSGNALKAIELINKMLGYNAPLESNINMNLEQPLFSDDDLNKDE